MTIVSDGNLDTVQLRIEQLLVGGTFTCILARMRSGFINRVRRLRCWGTHDINDNADGVAFDSTAAASLPLPPSPFADQTTDYVEAAAGGEHVCARPSVLYLNFHIDCMGMNFGGELGYGPLEASSWNPIYHHPDGFKLPVGYSDTSGQRDWRRDSRSRGSPRGVTTPARSTPLACCAGGRTRAASWASRRTGSMAMGIRSGRRSPVTLVSLVAGGEHTCGLTAAGAA